MHFLFFYHEGEKRPGGRASRRRRGSFDAKDTAKSLAEKDTETTLRL